MATQAVVWERKTKQVPGVRRQGAANSPGAWYPALGACFSNTHRRAGHRGHLGGAAAEPEPHRPAAQRSPGRLPVSGNSHHPAPAGAAGRRDALVSLFPLAKRMAVEMRARLPANVELEDLVGAGVLGLVDAVDKFDMSKRVKLETYARHRIRGSMLDSLRALDPASRDLRRKKRKIEQLYRELGNRLGRHVLDEEMAEALGVDLEAWYGTLAELQTAGCAAELGRQPVRRRPSARADGDGAGIPDPQPGPFELLVRREQRDILERAVAWLPERAREVLTLYYRHELTMRQIATRLGVDESRISQIHLQAMARLRSAVQALLHRPRACAAGRPLPCRQTEADADLGLIPGVRSGSLPTIGSLNH